MNAFPSAFSFLVSRFAKWAILGALWIGSLGLVTLNTQVMDWIGKGVSLLPGSLTTPYANQKQKHAELDEKVASQKRAVRAQSLRVDTFSKRMVTRNIADATTSLIPLIGGAASVTFAAADVYAACELLEMQAAFEEIFEIESQPSPVASVCAEATEQVSKLVDKASEVVE